MRAEDVRVGMRVVWPGGTFLAAAPLPDLPQGVAEVEAVALETRPDGSMLGTVTVLVGFGAARRSVVGGTPTAGAPMTYVFDARRLEPWTAEVSA